MFVAVCLVTDDYLTTDMDYRDCSDTALTEPPHSTTVLCVCVYILRTYSTVQHFKMLKNRILDP